MMNKMQWILPALMAAFLAAGAVSAEEKEKGEAALTANTGLYPADFGPAEIDVTEYPPQMKKNYRVFAFKCAACHTIARPINSQFIELTADEQAALKKEAPELDKDRRLGLIEETIWKRYVKRMMSKPGCPVKGEDGKQIWEFLAYDSRLRKTGANAKSWAAFRLKLVEDFKRDYPDAYKTVFAAEIEEMEEHIKGGKKGHEEHEKHEKEEKD